MLSKAAKAVVYFLLGVVSIPIAPIYILAYGLYSAGKSAADFMRNK